MMDRHKRLPYQSLEQSKRQFRLIRLHDTGSDCIQCELAIFSLLDNDLPNWKALSYRWGDDPPEFVVHLDGYPVPIRKNLHSIITQMVTEQQKTWIFIDAICIDQDDELEKPSQVSYMGEIYRRAIEVLAWLIYEPYQTESDAEEETDGTNSDSRNALSFSRKELEAAVAENSYWSRLWIVQEVLLAKWLTIRIGNVEVDWMRLLPEKTYFNRVELPIKNQGITESHQTTEPWVNATKAVNILSYRRFESESLRTGNRLPFHRAFDFFALQNCGRRHDKVFGYLGLTNSRMQVDYSLSVLDLFITTFADYLMSVGLITDDFNPVRRRVEFLRFYSPIQKANGLIAPLSAFSLDLYDPVVSLLFYEVLKFFVPGFEESLYCTTISQWFMECDRQHAIRNALEDLHHEFEWKYIGSTCIKVIKLVSKEMSASRAKTKEMSERRKALAVEDAMLTYAGSGETKRYSEWASHAKTLSDQMWQRFQESGNDADGDLDDESWTLVA